MVGVKSRTVVVTAGGSGIGLAIARAFLDCGDRVFICDVSQGNLANAIQTNPTLKGTIADIGDPQAVAKMMAIVRRDIGDVDVLVNNAGIAGPTASAESIATHEWDATLDINLNGMFYCIREVLPAMKSRGNGSIINISSCSARVGMTNRLPYVTSKVGVLGLNYALAREVGPFGIRVNAILPGPVDGPRCRAMVRERAKECGISEQQAETEFLKHVSMKTWIQPAEIGDMSVFLASDKACHVTGQAISVDGLIDWEA